MLVGLVAVNFKCTNLVYNLLMSLWVEIFEEILPLNGLWSFCKNVIKLLSSSFWFENKLFRVGARLFCFLEWQKSQENKASSKISINC